NLRPYAKLASWLYLVRFGLPTLRGLVVTRLEEDDIPLLLRLGRHLDAKSLLLRSDKPGEYGADIPGGHIVSIEDWASVCRSYLSRGRVVFFLEPRSRFSDQYSVSLG